MGGVDDFHGQAVVGPTGVHHLYSVVQPNEDENALPWFSSEFGGWYRRRMTEQNPRYPMHDAHQGHPARDSVLPGGAYCKG